MPITNFPFGIQATPVIGADLLATFAGGKVFFVDGDAGSDSYDGFAPELAKKTIQAAVTAAAALGDGSIVYIKALDIAVGSTDPGSYAETIIIPATGARMALVGVGNGRTQGGLPQIKKGAGSTALLTVRAPGCLIANLGFNGGSSTGGGILLDDNGTTKTAFGTSIVGCHFKNCVDAGGINGKLGGAIQLSGAPWQILIKGNRFYKNLSDITAISVAYSDPQDIVIEDNIFSGNATDTDLNLYLTSGGAGALGIVIRNNVFPAFPNITSGVNKLFCVLTGCTGIMANNFFGGNGKTFDVDDGTGGLVPATMLMAGNYQEVSSSGGGTSGAFSRDSA